MGPKKYYLGGKQVSKSTYYQHRSHSNSDASLEDVVGPSRSPQILLLVSPSTSSSSPTSSPSSKSSMGFPMLDVEDSPTIGEPTNSLLTPSNEFQLNDIDK